jgi:5-(carboxyamino)imidazole ribonucleotide synthase
MSKEIAKSNKIAASHKTENAMTILPPATIGILGGGQLGRMIANEAREMGYHILTLDPTENSPCGQAADRQIVAGFDSIDGAKKLAQASDVITYEFENIGAHIAGYLEQGSYLPQGYDLLYTTQNRLREKAAIVKVGGKVAPYVPVHSVQDLTQGIQQFDYPVVLKTTEGGYDGKGQLVLRAEEQLSEAENMVTSSTTEWVLEKFVPYAKELSVVVARSPQGEVKAFPVAENIHEQNILHLSIAPARITEEIERKATILALQLAESFHLVGLLAIEMFLQEDGTIYVNELAPRPHNSGHYTQQACLTSQFEQHVRAICNLPLGETEIVHPTVMVNILGEHLEDVIAKIPTLDATYKVHLYGKKEAKAKRKMGHLNVVANTIDEALEKIKRLKIWKMEGI